MANEKQRYISTSFWDDEWTQELDPSEKLLFLYLLMNPLTNIAGVYHITIRRMEFDTGFNKDTIKRILARFENDGKVYYYKYHVIITNYPKHQKYKERPKIAKGIENVIDGLPGEIQKYMVSIGYAYPIGNLCNYSDSDSDSDLDSEADKEPSNEYEPCGDFVYLRPSEYEELCATFSTDLIVASIRSMNIWVREKKAGKCPWRQVDGKYGGKRAVTNWLERDGYTAAKLKVLHPYIKKGYSLAEAKQLYSEGTKP